MSDIETATAPKRRGRAPGTLNRATLAARAAAAEGAGGGGGRPAEGVLSGRARARGATPRIRMVRTGLLVPWDGNPRTHTEAQVDKLARSIQEFGFTNPILTDGKRRVLAGHGRVLAAKQLGLYSVPTIALAHLTPEQRRTYVIADNQLALAAGWDEDLLRVEIGELKVAGVDLSLTGFDTRTLNGLLKELTATAPEPRQKVHVHQEVGCPSCGHVFKV